MIQFFGGMIAMGYFAAALFFVRFFRRTRDQLFAVFAAAFALLAIGTVAVQMTGYPREENGWIYLFRLAAFLLIIVAILRKNLQARERAGGRGLRAAG